MQRDLTIITPVWVAVIFRDNENNCKGFMANLGQAPKGYNKKVNFAKIFYEKNKAVIIYCPVKLFKNMDEFKAVSATIIEKVKARKIK